MKNFSDSDDYVFCLRFPQKQDDRGYEWKVTKDPTRDGFHPGLFFGNLFRMIDLRLDRDEISTWPDGIVFEHIQTGQKLSFRQGKLFDLTNNRCLEKKPRVRLPQKRIRNQGIYQSTKESKMRRFLLIRKRDTTGISGTGVVAEGTVFTDGLSVIRWLREPYAMGVYSTLKDVIAVHGHGGDTQLQFVDQSESTNSEGG
jgi:hypothetical protein